MMMSFKSSMFTSFNINKGLNYSKERNWKMEALYQPFLAVPINSVGILGLIQMIFIAGALIFKLQIMAPKKEKIDPNK